MNRSFFLTSVGKKYLMGFSGLIWAGFIAAHMAGNMLMFISPDLYNAYGHAITSGMSIYAIEGLLLLALTVHVMMAVLLTVENRKARGDQRYAMTPNGDKAAIFASKTMAIQGSIILVFVILHLATFKFGTYYETTVDGVVMRDLHRLLVEVFREPGYVVWYIVSMVILGFHLSHGVASIFQSFGVREDKWSRIIRSTSVAYAIIVAGGFLAQPISVFLMAGS